MEAAGDEKLVVVATHSSEDAEMATIPFVLASSALAMESKATIALPGGGVELVTQGLYERVRARGFDPLMKLVDSFLALGGQILVCIPCIESREISPERLVPGVILAKGGRIVQELLESTAVVSY